MGAPTLAQFNALVSRVNSLDGQNLPNPKAAVVVNLYAKINGVKTSLQQSVALLQQFLGTNQSALAGLTTAVQTLTGIMNNGLPTYLTALTIYSFAELPNPGTNGQVAYVSDGLKIGETTGNGTGVPAYYSNNGWQVLSTDTPVHN